MEEIKLDSEDFVFHLIYPSIVEGTNFKFSLPKNTIYLRGDIEILKDFDAKSNLIWDSFESEFRRNFQLFGDKYLKDVRARFIKNEKFLKKYEADIKVCSRRLIYHFEEFIAVTKGIIYQEERIYRKKYLDEDYELGDMMDWCSSVNRRTGKCNLKERQIMSKDGVSINLEFHREVYSEHTLDIKAWIFENYGESLNKVEGDRSEYLKMNLSFIDEFFYLLTKMKMAIHFINSVEELYNTYSFQTLSSSQISNDKSKELVNDNSEITGEYKENPYPYIQIKRYENGNAVSGTNQRLLLFFTYIDKELLNYGNRNKIADWFQINLERFEKTCGDKDLHKTWFKSYCNDVRSWIEQTDNPEIINKFNLDFPH